MYLLKKKKRFLTIDSTFLVALDAESAEDRFCLVASRRNVDPIRIHI